MYYNYDENNENRNDEVIENSPAEDAEKAKEINNEEIMSEQTQQEKPVYKYNEPWTEPSYSKANETSYNYYSPNYSNSAAYNTQPMGRSYSSMNDQAVETEGRKKKRGGFGRALAIILVCVILCSAASAGSAYLVVDHYMDKIENYEGNRNTVILGDQSNSSSKVNNDDKDSDYSISGSMLTGVEIYKIAEKQVVGISTTYTTTNIFGQQSTSAVTGTGFVISEDGYILTNHHVIELAIENEYEVKVSFKNGDTYTAEIIGHYEANDVAVIKIDATGLVPISLGNSDNMQVGEQVFCVGNPLGELDFSMTTGYLSALDRLIATDTYTTINMFQFDAAVNSGNSGGPVYNTNGEVIGIVTAKYNDTGVEGIGFAIPINDAVNISKDLIEHGYLTGQAYLGVSIRDVESYVTNYYKIPEGAYIESIEKDSCAEKAGLQVQDIIIGLDDYEISSVEELKRTLRKYNAGDTATIKVHRFGTGNLEFSITFDENLTNQKEAATNNK